MAVSYHELGMVAQDRGRLEEAADWYARSLAIKEELDDRPKMALTYSQLGLLAEEQDSPGEALEWTVRCVALFDDVPHPGIGDRPWPARPPDPSAGLRDAGGLLAAGHRRPAAWRRTRLRPLSSPG